MKRFGKSKKESHVSVLKMSVSEVSDAQAITDLVNLAYRGEKSRQGWTTEADFLDGQRTDVEAIQAIMSEPDAKIMKFDRGGSLLGCVLLRQKKSQSRAYLGMLTVSPELQGAGIGREMLALAETWVASNWHFPVIEMTVIQLRTELISWYQRRGYDLTERREPFPYGNDRFGVPKVSGLEFVILEKTLIPVETLEL
jgi:ribosomal protein S18 acetylase RimI-like enzyme